MRVWARGLLQKIKHRMKGAWAIRNNKLSRLWDFIQFKNCAKIIGKTFREFEDEWLTV